MKVPEFEITIAKDGTVEVHVKGASGKECLKLADMVRDIVGREQSRRLTSEYHAGGLPVKIDAQVRGRTGE